MFRSFRISTAALAGSALALMPIAVQAHPAHEAQASIMQGLLHPLTGWDHLVVLLSLGILASGLRTTARLACAAMLVLAIGGGAALGIAWPATPFVEPAILLTVLASLALLVLRQRIRSGVLMALTLSFALIHGIAHGQEAPAGDLAGYFSGFTLAGLMLFGAGVYVARRLFQKGAPITSRQPGKSPARR